MIKVFKGNDNFEANGTSLSGYIKTTYNNLIEVLGPPTYDEASGDDKVQIEWVVEFEGNIFTIYDWKTYNREYTINELTDWHIGSKVNASKFINKLEKLLSK